MSLGKRCHQRRGVIRGDVSLGERVTKGEVSPEERCHKG